jgi:hypothetical protein
VKQQLNQHTDSLLKSVASMLWNRREVRTFRALVALFLDTEKRTTLQNVSGVSASTASRFLSCEHAPDSAFWQCLNHWQFQSVAQLPRRGRRRDVLLKLDLTCIEKRGQQIPFACVFNKRYGIQLVMLHACVDGVAIPLGYRIYQGKGTANVVTLALDLLAEFPASRFVGRVVVLADAAFGTAGFICEARQLGFAQLLLGMRCDRRLNDGRRVDDVKRRGEQVRLHDLNDEPLWLSYCDVKRDTAFKRYYVVATFKAVGSYLAKRYRRRWLIESFFKSIKHDFGLKEARLRTETGIRMWLFLGCLAYSLARVEHHRTTECSSLIEAASRVLWQLVDVAIVRLLTDCERLAQALGRPVHLGVT